MRRFSKRNSLVTLNEINITPLLDLAFVLLIIFIIVSGSIKNEQSIDITLPKGGSPRRETVKEDLRTVSVSRKGVYFLGNRPLSLDAIVRELKDERRLNPNLTVELRVDEEVSSKYPIELMDRLWQGGFVEMGLPTLAPNQK